MLKNLLLGVDGFIFAPLKSFYLFFAVFGDTLKLRFQVREIYFFFIGAHSGEVSGKEFIVLGVFYIF